MNWYVEQRWYINCNQSTSLFLPPTVPLNFNKDNYLCLPTPVEYLKRMSQIVVCRLSKKESPTVIVEMADF